MRIRLLALAVIVPTALVAACSNEPTEGVVARVGDHSLTVDDVVDLLVDQEEFPPQADVVAAIIDLWVDYTLLGEAVMDDTTFSGLDLEALVRQAENASMIARLRDSVIQVDTFITNDELQARYEAEAPDLELRARHVMLTLPLQATDAQRDSVRGQLENLRDRIVSGGESFGDVARTFSQDIGSASNGGDLGFFGRGEMVQPFEEAVLALELGEISQIVETPMGLHLIQLDERRTQDFDDIASDFRTREQARSYITAESTFVAQLEERAQPEVMDDAVEVVRELARNPETRLSGRAERRPLVSWEGGEYSVGELQLLIRIEPQAMREQLIQFSDEEIDLFLQNMARGDLLLAEAQDQGFEPSRARIDSLVVDASSQLLEAARVLGLTDIDIAPGEAVELGIARAVREALRGNLSGATPTVPLGFVGFQLREGVSFTSFDTGIGESLLQIAQIRAERSLSPLEEAQDSTALPADTLER